MSLMKEKIAFVLVAESGDLELKACLLVESIRRFGGEFSQAPIWVIQPRRGKVLSPSTLKNFSANGVSFVSLDLNKKWQHYGVANKVYAAAFVEGIIANTVENLVLLDSDTILVQPPYDLLLQREEVIGFRPVDTINIGLPIDAPVNDYWKIFYDAFQVSLVDVWSVETTSKQQKIKAYFNSGLVVVKSDIGIFQCWKDFFERFAFDKRIQEFDPSSKEFFHLDQVSLAALVLGKFSQSQVRLLDYRYNFPLHLYCKKNLYQNVLIENIEDLVLVHYHHLFYNLEWLKNIGVSKETKAWFLKKLPLLNLKKKRISSPTYKIIKDLLLFSRH